MLDEKQQVSVPFSTTNDSALKILSLNSEPLFGNNFFAVVKLAVG